mgnify:CR=1 FL=1
MRPFSPKLGLFGRYLINLVNIDTSSFINIDKKIKVTSYTELPIKLKDIIAYKNGRLTEV